MRKIRVVSMERVVRFSVQGASIEDVYRLCPLIKTRFHGSTVHREETPKGQLVTVVMAEPITDEVSDRLKAVLKRWERTRNFAAVFE